jgi:D-glycero-alpha-D-manno-heptose-7-phosphate kinase
MIKTSGSVRVDLLGGTLDISPIHLIIPNAFTLNLATTLKAEVCIEPQEQNNIIIESKDYNSSQTYSLKEFNKENLQSDFFGPLKFIALILNHFKLDSGYKITLSSGSPTGAGLGGSSSMGAVLYKALCQLTNQTFDKTACINNVQGYESIILNKGPAGYQDYHPAVYGGVLALKPQVGKIEVEQLYQLELKEFLEKRMTLIYSGETRLSGINNWEVYKGFFDGEEKIVSGLKKIADLSYQAYLAIKNKEYPKLINLIGEEGATRKVLFPGIVSPSMDSLYNEVREELTELKMKVCGAGGGGCFLLLHNENERSVIINHLKKYPKMRVLDFEVDSPLN